MSLFLLTLVFALSAVITAWREPRRLRPGVYLGAALLTAILGITGLIVEIAADNSTKTGAVVLLVLGVCGLLAMTALGVYLLGNGFEMIRREGRRPATMLSLVLGAAIFGYVIAVVVGIVIGWFEPGPSNTLLLLLAAVGLPAAYLGFVLAVVVLWSYLYGWWGRRRAKREPVGAVIVLGAGLIDGCTVGPLLAGRLDRGMELYDFAIRTGRRPVLVCSGGRGSDERRSEAAAMADYAIDHGAEPDRVIREDRSTDTAENLRYSAQLLRERGIDGPVAVVTSNYHAFRAATLMRQVSLDGFSTGAPTASYFVPNAELREYAAILRDHRWLNIAAVVMLSVPWLAGVWNVMVR
ncbi:YdcF family protein [Gordonia sp. CPCC 205515]|uniref:YdcF family protein n=1 Tax=Gordonia sp. CPCC 205515 TaxID=3140791 RepID=UPI003AF3BAE1